MTEQKIPIPRLTAFESYAANQIATRNEIAGPQLAEEEIKRILTKADKILNCYFKIEFFDIYLASSLRNFKDFEKTERVLKEIETAMPGIKILWPGLCGVSKNVTKQDAPNEKGDIDRFFMWRSQAFIGINMQRGTWGKYSEAMHFLLAGKPTIFVVNNQKALNIFQKMHPIKLVGNPFSSNGFHVTTKLATGLECLTAELRKTLELEKIISVGNHKVRATNFVCPFCKSIIKRKSNWIKYASQQR